MKLLTGSNQQIEMMLRALYWYRNATDCENGSPLKVVVHFHKDYANERKTNTRIQINVSTPAVFGLVNLVSSFDTASRKCSCHKYRRRLEQIQFSTRD